MSKKFQKISIVFALTTSLSASVDETTTLEGSVNLYNNAIQPTETRKQMPQVEIIAEEHRDKAGATYARSLTELDVYMIEHPLILNGIFEAFDNDKISQKQLASFLQGYASENIAFRAANTAETIAHFKEKGVKTIAYVGGLSYVAGDRSETGLLIGSKQREYTNTENVYNALLNTLKQIYGISDFQDPITVAELKARVRGGMVRLGTEEEFREFWSTYFPDIQDLPDDYSLKLGGLETVIEAMEERKQRRLKDIDYTVTFLREYGDKSGLAKSMATLVREEKAKGITSQDEINATVIAAIVEEKGYSGNIIIVNAGESHVSGSLVIPPGRVLAEGTLDESLISSGMNVTITSVRDNLSGFDAGHYITSLPDCTQTTNFTQYVIVDPETGEQTVFNNREELKALYEETIGEVSSRFADYCHTDVFTPPEPNLNK